MLYNVSGVRAGNDPAKMWQQIFKSSPLRLTLSEPPQETGGSAQWKQEIEDKLDTFKKRWGHVIDPLLVPVALEVVMQPPPLSRQRGVSDLDNILREYIIPRVVSVLNPISHHVFAIGSAPTKPRMPPPSTRSGVTRFEAFRLPPAREGSSGFVSAAIVADWTGLDSVLGRVDSEIEVGRESLENS